MNIPPVPRAASRTLTALAALVTVAVMFTATGCTLTVDGVATRNPHELHIENSSNDQAGRMARDALTLAVEYWSDHGVNLSSVTFRQWDSNRDDPVMCHGSVFPQASFCVDGWLAWDRQWVFRAIRQGHVVPLVYMSRAVANAVLHTLPVDPEKVDTHNMVECLTGAMMSWDSGATSRAVGKYVGDLNAYVRGLESEDPLRDCLRA